MLVYISIPIIAALIGWFTNYVAVKMLFRPRHPLRILGFTFHGVVPRRQKELALKLGEMVEHNLISHKDIEKVLQSADVERELGGMIDEQVESFMGKFSIGIPMIEMFLQGSIKEQVKRVIADQLKANIPNLLDRMMTKVEQGIDFKEIVREKVEGFDLGKLEQIIYDISARELRTIELLGGVLGFLVGLAQVGLMVLSADGRVP